MQRCHTGVLFNVSEYTVVHQCGLLETLTTVNDAMSNCNGRDPSIGNHRLNRIQCFCMAGIRRQLHFIFTAIMFESETSIAIS